MNRTTLLSDIAAGMLTAVVFYAEYISLGATLGAQIPGAGKDSAHVLGSLLVIGAVMMCCVSSLVWRLPVPLLSGPRAASLLLMIAGLGWVQSHATANLLLRPLTATVAMGLMLLAASLVQLLGLVRKVRDAVERAPRALTRGFMFVTATGIVAGMVENQLSGCLQFDFWPTLVVFGVSVGVASAWMKWCDQGASVRKRLKVGTIFVGMGVAWGGYAWLLPGASSRNGCGTLGAVGLRWETLGERFIGNLPLDAAWHGLNPLQWLVIAGIGVAMGLVQLIESLMALEANDRIGTDHDIWPRYIAASATANLFSATFGLASSAWSGARSTTLAQSHASTRVAVASHGIALMVLALAATRLVAALPVLAVAVALTLVAVQMIDEKTEKEVWQAGYQKLAAPRQVQAAWLFWVVVCTGFFSGKAIYGLLAGAVLAGAHVVRVMVTTPKDEAAV